MSATYPDPELDREEQLARIVRLREEGLKFATEQRKLAAEAEKFGWDRYVTLVVALGGAVVAATSAVVAAASLLRH